MEKILNSNASDSVCAVALIRQSGAVLMGLREYVKGSPVWTYPGGRGDGDETVEDLLRREVEEEVGINDLQFIAFLGQKAGVKPGDIVHFFSCSTKQDFINKEPEKFLRWEMVKLDQLPKNLIDEKDKEFLLK